jgi:hypothetical protein
MKPAGGMHVDPVGMNSDPRVPGSGVGFSSFMSE